MGQAVMGQAAKGPAGHRRVVERGGAHSQATCLPTRAKAPCGPAARGGA